MMRWAAYWCRLRNWADMLASAARQLVWRYLSCSGGKHTNATRSHFWKHPCSPPRPCRPTLVRVMLNWMVRMTTRMSKLPREISVSDLSEYHVMFFSTCESERGTQTTWEWHDARATCVKVSKAPQIVSTHHLVDGAIEGIILCENEQNNERHVDVMRISVLHMVKDLEDGQNLRGKQGKEAECVSLVAFIKSWFWAATLCKCPNIKIATSWYVGFGHQLLSTI